MCQVLGSLLHMGARSVLQINTVGSCEEPHGPFTTIAGLFHKLFLGPFQWRSPQCHCDSVQWPSNVNMLAASTTLRPPDPGLAFQDKPDVNSLSSLKPEVWGGSLHIGGYHLETSHLGHRAEKYLTHLRLTPGGAKLGGSISKVKKRMSPGPAEILSSHW